MKFKAQINIMPRPEILDPQGKATQHGLKNLGFNNVEGLRVGRRIELTLEAADQSAAEAEIQTACKKLLANTITEVFSFEVVAL
ncbi:MAG: phosphoribosylformylglycinamidine synthase subunit PurS [Bacteroidia bacterium]